MRALEMKPATLKIESMGGLASQRAQRAQTTNWTGVVGQRLFSRLPACQPQVLGSPVEAASHKNPT